jgi:predicted Zn-dependent peptidase
MVQIWNKVPPIEQTVERIDAVTREDVLAFAQDQASNAAPALALYGPVDQAPALEALQARRAA